MITRERWQRIKDVFNQALNQPARERSKFISEACDGDDALREEVESLVSAHEEEDDFLDAPAHELAAEMLTGDIPELRAGQEFGPYTILSSLGSGGMGEVYLAQDASLDRKVALKLLTREFARDQQRVHRFKKEARAASALNHPNVCVIHEIGKADDGRHFIKMEFIDGITLRRRMAQKRLTWKEALDVATQVAKGLKAAHEAHIVHRDIKPENIMLRQDGFVKVLDFGIAKLNAAAPGHREVKDYTTTNLRTAPGTLMGTAKYMSPEQLREQTIDARTDIWSLGVVLYEMITGSTPFEALTTNETIAIILERQTAQLDFSGVTVPLELQQVIKKALSKKRDERYHTIREFASDLSRLESADGTGKGLEPSEPTPVEDDSGTLPDAEATTLFEIVLSKIRSQAVSTAEYVLSEIKQHKTAAVFTSVTAVFALLIIGWKLPGLIEGRTPTPPRQTMKMELLTNSGNSVCAAISPDGKSVAHAEKKNGMQELVITDLLTRGNRSLVAPGKFEYRGVTFSRDNDYVYFTRTEVGIAENERDEIGVLYKLGLYGSPPQKIIDRVDSPISLSPNGDRFAFVRHNANGSYSLLTAASADGSSEREIAVRQDGSLLSIYGPSWSPDGASVVTGAGSWENGYHSDLVEVGVEDGHEKPIGRHHWFSIREAAWLKDRSGLIISAKEQALDPFRLWRIPYPSGEPTKVTNDLPEYDTVSLSGNTIVTLRTEEDWKLWSLPGGDPQNAKPIRAGGGRSYGMNWIKGGKILFSAMAGNNQDIFRIDSDGSNEIQLTSHAGDNYMPAASSDGRYIVFASNRSGSFNIWRMNADDGSDQRQLTTGDGNFYPSVSADDQWVLYDNQTNARMTIWRVPIDGGAQVQITDKWSRMPIGSPDNQFIACRYADSAGQVIAILPFAGGPPVSLLSIKVFDWQRVQWTADGRGLTYIQSDHGASNVWSYDIASRSRKQLTDFKSDQIFAYGWSSDYKQLACERGNRASNVTRITNAW
jgi:serine/threonine protein kinase/Tol biopolymer transport system component